LHSHLGWRKFNFVVEYDKVSQTELGIFKGLLHGAAGLVHPGRRLEQHDALAIERAFGGLALKTTAPWCETMTPRDFLNGHEPDVVPVLRVFCAGITEANKETHSGAPCRVRLLLLVAATGRRFRTRRRSCSSTRGRSRRSTGRRRSSARSRSRSARSRSRSNG